MKLHAQIMAGLFVSAILLGGAGNQTPPKSSLDQKVAQAVGNFCQTPRGFCPLVDANNNPITLPLGSACKCGGEDGFVIQR